MERPLSLYVHIPFCRQKCPYCSFNSYAGQSRLAEPYVQALVREIRWAGAAGGRPLASTLYLGGGTPTVLPTALLAQVIDACQHAFDLLPDAEISCEANPGTVDSGYFAALRQMGVNRLSLGVQSLDPGELALLGRVHSAEAAVAAYRAARAAGFDNINLDFIYGLPDQSPAAWQRTLEQALALAPEHISLYSLTIEEGTPFGDWAAAGQLAEPDPDGVADLYEMAGETLANARYVQYEISNWAKEEEDRCRHNLACWRNEAYLGFGAGAHSSEDGWRWATVQPVQAYSERITSVAVADLRPSHTPPWTDFAEEIDERLAMGETMMLGLRLVEEGVAFERFQQRHGRPMLDVFGAEIERLERLGLLERLPDRVRLSSRARLVGNQVFAAFLP